jgi:hypothetical protein
MCALATTFGTLLLRCTCKVGTGVAAGDELHAVTITGLGHCMHAANIWTPKNMSMHPDALTPRPALNVAIRNSIHIDVTCWLFGRKQIKD